MSAPHHRGESEHTSREDTGAPTVWIDVRRQEDLGVAQDQRYVAALRGLSALKCAGVRGYGSTEEEAVLNLRRKVLQFLEFQTA